MKDDFNIENRTPKNTYSTPSNFYDEVQKNVLRETSLVEIKSIDRNTKKISFKNFAIAASLIFMSTMLGVWTFNRTSEEVSFAENETKVQLSQKKETQLVEEVIQEKETPISLPMQEKIVEISKSEIRQKKSNVVTQLKKKMNEGKDVLASYEINTDDVEESKEEIILDELQDDELVELAQNIENDIYLELYN